MFVEFFPLVNPHIYFHPSDLLSFSPGLQGDGISLLSPAAKTPSLSGVLDLFPQHHCSNYSSTVLRGTKNHANRNSTILIQNYPLHKLFLQYFHMMHTSWLEMKPLTVRLGEIFELPPCSTYQLQLKYESDQMFFFSLWVCPKIEWRIPKKCLWLGKIHGPLAAKRRFVGESEDVA